jgi:O-antigen/teichoic acid export membrane protein
MELSEVWRRFARNSAMIVGSRMVFGLLNLATNAVVVRAFGLEALGVALLLQAYARLFSEIVKFQSWQAVLRYGPAVDGAVGLRRLLGFTLGIDLLGFAVAIAAAVLLVPWAADWFEWNGDVAGFAPVFVLSIVFITHATPTGVARLFDRVDALATQHAMNAALRFALVCLAAWLGGGAMHVVFAWFAASVISGTYLLAVVLRLVIRRGLVPDFGVNWLRADREFPAIWRFLVFSNVSTSIALVLNYGTTIVVGAGPGAAAAATWEIARQFGGAVGKPARLLGPLMFPELSRMAARNDWAGMRQVLLRQLVVSAAVLAGLGVVLFAGLPLLIRLAFGPELLGDIWLFRLAVLGALIALAGFLLEPAFLSAGKAGTLLAIQAGAIMVFVAIGLPTLLSVGLVGLGFALLAYHVAYNGLLLLVGRRLIRKRIRRSRHAAPAGPAAG